MIGGSLPRGKGPTNPYVTERGIFISRIFIRGHVRLSSRAYEAADKSPRISAAIAGIKIKRISHYSKAAAYFDVDRITSNSIRGLTKSKKEANSFHQS
jgi:hypothetical protein